MDGLENLARNLGTYTAPTYGMSLQKPTVTYGVFMDDDDDLYSMKAIFKKKSKATEPASAKPASTKPVTAKVKPVTTKVKPVTAKVNPVTAKVKPVTAKVKPSAKNKRAVTHPAVCSKLDKSSVLIKNSTISSLISAMELWEESCKIKSTINSNDIKYAGNKFTCYIDDFIWIYVSERNNGGRDLYLRVLSKKVTLRSRNEISKFVF